MSSDFRNFRSNFAPRSIRSDIRFVEYFFSSIDLLIEILVFLRRRVPDCIPFRYLYYFEKIENRLECLKAFSIAVENSLRHRIRRSRASRTELIRILRKFYQSVLFFHLQRIHLCRTIQSINPEEITLEMVTDKYRMVAIHLIRFGFQSFNEIDRN